MPTAEFLQLIVVAIVAGYIGYRLGQATAGRADAPSSPLPGPVADASEPQRERRSSAPPPAGAGDDAPGPTQQRTPPRRSSAPPPAAAGLMDRGGGGDA